jgi:hypothetical protein
LREFSLVTHQRPVRPQDESVLGTGCKLEPDCFVIPSATSVDVIDLLGLKLPAKHAPKDWRARPNHTQFFHHVDLKSTITTIFKDINGKLTFAKVYFTSKMVFWLDNFALSILENGLKLRPKCETLTCHLSFSVILAWHTHTHLKGPVFLSFETFIEGAA